MLMGFGVGNLLTGTTFTGFAMVCSLATISEYESSASSPMSMRGIFLIFLPLLIKSKLGTPDFFIFKSVGGI